MRLTARFHLPFAPGWGVMARVCRTAGIAVALSIGLSPACATEDSNGACARLRSYSCGCYPACQNVDIAAIDMADDAACTARLREAFNDARSCSTQCSLKCEYAWGRCAFDHYRKIGLEPRDPCGVNTDGGVDDAGADGSDAATDAAE